MITCAPAKEAHMLLCDNKGNPHELVPGDRIVFNSVQNTIRFFTGGAPLYVKNDSDLADAVWLVELKNIHDASSIMLMIRALTGIHFRVEEQRKNKHIYLVIE